MKTVLCAFVGLVCCVGSVYAQSAAEDWRKLTGSGEKVLTNPAFDFVENDPDLPNVLIYGDSISIHYTPALRTELKGKANVYRLHKNGGNSAQVIPAMQAMQAGMQKHWPFTWDVIQFNTGLHDLKYVTEQGKYSVETGKQVHTPEEYKKNLIAIVAYFKQIAPKAKLIFATTTPVPKDSYGRKAGDAARFNEVALGVFTAYPEIVINDLFSFTKPNQQAWWTKPGNVHYNEQGRAAQGKEVARVILENLP